MDDFICDKCRKRVGLVYFYGDKELCERCYRSQIKKDKEVVERKNSDKNESNIYVV